MISEHASLATEVRKSCICCIITGMKRRCKVDIAQEAISFGSRSPVFGLDSTDVCCFIDALRELSPAFASVPTNWLMILEAAPWPPWLLNTGLATAGVIDTLCFKPDPSVVGA